MKENYCVTPSHGIILPKGSFEIILFFYFKEQAGQKELIEKLSRHKFLFEFIFITEEESKSKPKEIFELYTKEKRKVKGVIQKKKTKFSAFPISSYSKLSSPDRGFSIAGTENYPPSVNLEYTTSDIKHKPSHEEIKEGLKEDHRDIKEFYLPKAGHIETPTKIEDEADILRISKLEPTSDPLTDLINDNEIFLKKEKREKSPDKKYRFK